MYAVNKHLKEGKVKKSKLHVVSLFDEISCGKIALNRLGISSEYHAFETDETQQSQLTIGEGNDRN